MTEEKRVLVADDDASMLKSLKRRFEAAGYIVDTAKSYSGVRNLLRERSFALIFSDNRMPIFDDEDTTEAVGLELMAYAKRAGLNKSTQFVLHTADDSEKIRKDVLMLGGTYVHKGTSFDEVVQLLLKK
jgi:CheY-like chemotaxis protein